MFAVSRVFLTDFQVQFIKNLFKTYSLIFKFEKQKTSDDSKLYSQRTCNWS